MGVILSRFMTEGQERYDKYAGSQSLWRSVEREKAATERALVKTRDDLLERLPWERQIKEPQKAYGYFAYYRDMDQTERSIKAIAERYHISTHTVTYFLRRYRWQERVRAWDADQDRIRREAFEKERIEMAKRQARLGVTMQEKASEGLLYVDPEKLAPREITVLADTGVKIERLARGESTENISQKSVQIVFEGDRPEWLPPNV